MDIIKCKGGMGKTTLSMNRVINLLLYINFITTMSSFIGAYAAGSGAVSTGESKCIIHTDVHGVCPHNVRYVTSAKYDDERSEIDASEFADTKQPTFDVLLPGSCEYFKRRLDCFVGMLYQHNMTELLNSDSGSVLSNSRIICKRGIPMYNRVCARMCWQAFDNCYKANGAWSKMIFPLCINKDVFVQENKDCVGDTISLHVNKIFGVISKGGRPLHLYEAVEVMMEVKHAIESRFRAVDVSLNVQSMSHSLLTFLVQFSMAQTETFLMDKVDLTGVAESVWINNTEVHLEWSVMGIGDNRSGGSYLSQGLLVFMLFNLVMITVSFAMIYFFVAQEKKRFNETLQEAEDF